MLCTFYWLAEYELIRVSLLVPKGSKNDEHLFTMNQCPIDPRYINKTCREWNETYTSKKSNVLFKLIHRVIADRN